MKKRSRNNTRKVGEPGRTTTGGQLLEVHEKVLIEIRETGTRTIGPKTRRRMKEISSLVRPSLSGGLQSTTKLSTGRSRSIMGGEERVARTTERLVEKWVTQS